MAPDGDSSERRPIYLPYLFCTGFNWISRKRPLTPLVARVQTFSLYLIGQSLRELFDNPVSSHSALPTCYVHGSVSLAAKLVGLAGYLISFLQDS